MEKSIDRLSALPDDVVFHILSFLPTKISVSTSILAKRWRLLWSLVPNLDFKIEHFNDNNNYYCSDIIHRVMLLHKSGNINIFSLSDIPCNEYQLETWITIAIQRNVRYLDFCLTGMSAVLPHCLFTCKTLVGLKLEEISCNPSIGTVSMPSLKKLHISCVECQVDEEIPHLLSGCPVLEELVIDFVYILDEDLGCLNISSPTLIRLEVNFRFDSSELDNPDYMLKINAPRLKYLKVGDYSDDPTINSFKHISVLPMTSLIEADIYFRTCFSCLDEEDDYSTRSAAKFLSCLSNVKCLKLSGPYPEKFLDVAITGSIVRFDNLTKLEVKLDADWGFVTKLLEIADNLEVLTVRVRVDGMYWIEPKEVPTCLLSRIRTIKMNRMVCATEEHVFNMVRYFLRNAQVLERMEIFSKLQETDFKGRFDVLQRISLFERGSKACQLTFY